MHTPEEVGCSQITRRPTVHTPDQVFTHQGPVCHVLGTAVLPQVNIVIEAKMEFKCIAAFTQASISSVLFSVLVISLSLNYGRAL